MMYEINTNSVVSSSNLYHNSAREFLSKLPNKYDVWKTSTFRYGCCGLPIEKESSSVREQEVCPHCVDEIRIKHKDCIIRYYPLIDGYFRLSRYDQVKVIDKEYSVDADFSDILNIPDLSKWNDCTYDIAHKAYSVLCSKSHELSILDYIEASLLPDFSSGGFYNISHGFNLKTIKDYIEKYADITEYIALLNLRTLIITEIHEEAINHILNKLNRAGMEML